jgi:hypothetical protein
VSREIPLSQGMVAIVDDEDYERLSKYRWFASKVGNNWYALRHSPRGQSPATVKMHRVVVGLEYRDKKQLDHINHNGLDNRRSNLRICDYAANQHNRKIRGTGTSQYKGVDLIAGRKKWRARICKQYRTYELGEFASEKEAAAAYDGAAIILFGEFACINFPLERMA